MARIRVGAGLFQVSLDEALQKAKPGDTLLLAAGLYERDVLLLDGFHIVGLGESGETVLRTRVNPVGTCRLERVTIEAPAFNNALTIRSAEVVMHQVELRGDPGVKYPAVFNEAGKLTMVNCRVVDDEAAVSIRLTEAAGLVAESSAIGWVRLEQSRAVATNCDARILHIENRSRFEARGSFSLAPHGNKRAVAISGESVCSLPILRQSVGIAEAWCQSSLLVLGEIDLGQRDKFTVYVKDAGRVTSQSPVITLVDEDAPKVAPEAPVTPVVPAPKAVFWRPEHARSFFEVIAPQARKGDTILMDEGEYFVGDRGDGLLRLGCHLAGRGRASHTILHATLSAMGGEEVEFSNLTVRADSRHAALLLDEPATVHLTNVTFEQELGDKMPVAVHIVAGQAVMEGCTVRTYRDRLAGGLYVGPAGDLLARSTGLGQMRVGTGGRLCAEQCNAMLVTVEESGVFTATGTFITWSNKLGLCTVLVRERGRAEFEQLTTEGGVQAFSVRSGGLAIGQLLPGEGGSVTVVTHGECDVHVDGDCTVVEAAQLRAGGSAEPRGVPTSPADTETPDEQRSEGENSDNESSPVDFPDGVSRNEEQLAGDIPPKPTDPMSAIMLLTGLAKVKEQIRAFIEIVEYEELRRQQGLPPDGQTLHSMFLGNPGTGKTTVARLLASTLHAAGAIREDKLVEVSRKDLVSDNIGGSARATHKVLQGARGGVLFIDEAYTLYQEEHNEFAQEAVDTLLAYMENHRDDLVVILAGYEAPMHNLMRMNEGLASRIPNVFEFEDYTADEVASIGLNSLESSGYVVDDDLYRHVVTLRYRQSIEHSNGRWVRNFNESLKRRVASRVVAQRRRGLSVDVSRIEDEDLQGLVGGDALDRQAAVEALVAELDAMTGLQGVKSWVRQLVDTVRADQMLTELGGDTGEKPTYHMIFAGNPGTGKTTVARIVAGLFHNLGILEKSTVKEVGRRDLVGAYIGHTEKQTTEVVDNAMGGVLFLDEAYQLTVGDSDNDFGRLAIETLLPRLENDRDKFIAIFAGYTREMNHFMAANPGLRSRVPLFIEFPDYSADEVAEIVVARLRRTWRFDAEHLAQSVIRVYESLPSQDRANGRWARNFADLVERQHKQWFVHAAPDDLLTIPDEVINAAAALVESGQSPTG